MLGPHFWWSGGGPGPPGPPPGSAPAEHQHSLKYDIKMLILQLKSNIALLSQVTSRKLNKFFFLAAIEQEKKEGGK